MFKDNPLFSVVVYSVIGAMLSAIFVIALQELSNYYPKNQLIFLRNFLGVLLTIPFIVYFHRSNLPRILIPSNLKLLILRCAIGSIGMFCLFYAYIEISHAQVTALSFTAPLWSTILAMLFLGERIRIYRSLALCVAFIGVLVTVLPDLLEGTFNFYHALVIISSITTALTTLFTRQISQNQDPYVITFYVYVMFSFATLLLTPLTASFSEEPWLMPRVEDLGLFSLLALSSMTQLVFVLALGKAEVFYVALLDYLRLPAVALCSWVILGQPITIYVVVGGTLIIGANIVIAVRSAMLAKRDRFRVAATIASPLKAAGAPTKSVEKEPLES